MKLPTTLDIDIYHIQPNIIHGVTFGCPVRSGRPRVTSASLLALVGLLLLLVFCFAGVAHLFYPLPPFSTLNVGEAALMCMAGIILMALTHCIAFYLGVIATLNLRDPADVKRGKKLWGDVFKVIPTGISLLKDLAKPADGHGLDKP